MLFFIEKYYSSFTNNILYSKCAQEIKYLHYTLSATASTLSLTTRAVYKFKWMKEKNGIYWFNGLRRLQPTPWKYIIPPLHFLNGTVRPKAIIRYEAPLKRKEVVYEKVAGQLF